MNSLSKFRDMLIRHEGLRLKPYRCTMGRLTIGIGRNIEQTGISKEEAFILLANDIERVQREAVEHLPWFKSLSVPRQDVILSMLFQLGLGGVKKFEKMVIAIRCGNFERAADEMLASLWAKQTPARAQELAKMMREGRYPPEN